MQLKGQFTNTFWRVLGVSPGSPLSLVTIPDNGHQFTKAS